MNLVIYKVNQLQHVRLTHRHRLIERLARTTVIQLNFARVIRIKYPVFARHLTRLGHLAVRCIHRGFFAVHLIEWRHLKSRVQVLSSPAQQRLKYLAYVHSRRHTQRI